VWAAPIVVDRGRDEIVAVAETRDEGGRTFTVVGLRLEGTRLIRIADDAAYRLDETRAAWIGASLPDLALHLEVAIDGDTLAVGGVLVHSAGDAMRELAPLLPVTIRRRTRTGEIDKGRTDAASGPAATDAGPDTGVAPLDAGHPDGATPPAPHAEP
jgi:hypothetical protein